MNVHVDEALCGSSGNCIEICPEVFALNTDGTAKAKSEEVPPELESACIEAADNCPNGAIWVEE